MEARILIADQNPAVTLVMRRHFEAAGHEVDVAHDGLDALEMGSTGDSDLALIDHFLPTVLGAEVLQTWMENGIDIPTISVSTLRDESMIVRCLELGPTSSASRSKPRSSTCEPRSTRCGPLPGVSALDARISSSGRSGNVS